jgi:hypothetical protein
MEMPGACLPTSGSHAHGASDASSFSTRDSFLFFGDGICVKRRSGGVWGRSASV